MNNYTKINTKNHPEFLELGDDYNDPIILMKEMESMNESMNDIKGLLIVQGMITVGILGLLIILVL